MANIVPCSLDMSLRLYSEDVPLAPIVRRLGLAVAHLHVKGSPMAEAGALAGRPAKRHYASVGCTRGSSIAEMQSWLGRMERTVAADVELVDLLRHRAVEAVFWIAVFGEATAKTPEPMPGLCEAIAKLPAVVLVENYACDGAEIPSKTWFPSRADAG